MIEPGFIYLCFQITTYSSADTLILSLILTQVSSSLEISKPSKTKNLFGHLSNIPFWLDHKVICLSSTYLLPNFDLFLSLMTFSPAWSQLLSNDLLLIKEY